MTRLAGSTYIGGGWRDSGQLWWGEDVGRDWRDSMGGIDMGEDRKFLVVL
jgi:hypothetical protein